MKIVRNISAAIADRYGESDLLWNLASKSVVRWCQYLCQSRRMVETRRIVRGDRGLHQIFSEAKVIRGPFEGMSYGRADSFCSAYFPKILGVYEQELESVILKALSSNYPVVVDVGAAEGYYAVGFALRSPASRIITFEQSPVARRQLRLLAEANGVSGKIEMRERCEPEDLMNLKAERGLMIVDCEGYEDRLLSPELIAHLHQWDFLVETHDGFVKGVTLRLQDRFRETHHVIVVETVHDLDKADRFPLRVLSHLSRNDQDLLLSEQREHATLRWIFCKAGQASETALG
jgi:hypothetical protein